MNFWNVAKSAAGGVGAVALLPVAGPIGAVGTVGAVVAGTLGVAVGAAVSAVANDKEDIRQKLHEAETKQKAAEQALKDMVAKKAKDDAAAKKAKGDEEAKEEERAREEAEKEKLRKAKEEIKRAKEALCKQTFKFIESQNEFFICCKLSIAMSAVDGEVSEKERNDIDLFLSGAKGQKAKKLVTKVEDIIADPPSIGDIINEIKSSDVYVGHSHNYLDLLEHVMLADGVFHIREVGLIAQFVEAFPSLTMPSSIPFYCKRSLQKMKGEMDKKWAIVEFCLDSKEGQCEIWINNECHTVNKPLSGLSIENFTERFDSVALGEIEDIDECSGADFVRFVFCGDEDAFQHAKKIIAEGGKRYSICRCTCNDDNDLD